MARIFSSHWRSAREESALKPKSGRSSPAVECKKGNKAIPASKPAAIRDARFMSPPSQFTDSSEDDISKNPSADQRKLCPLALVCLDPVDDRQGKVDGPAAHAHQPDENKWPEKGKRKGVLVGRRKACMHENVYE